MNKDKLEGFLVGLSAGVLITTLTQICSKVLAGTVVQAQDAAPTLEAVPRGATTSAAQC
jgi:hypothetical protein